MKFRNLFWGIILIFIGTLAILNNLDVIDFAWRKLWNLWPVIIMLWGISILPIKDGIRLGLVIITLGLTIFYISNEAVYTNTGNISNSTWNNNDWNDDEFEEEGYTEYDNDTSNHTNFLIPYSESIETATLQFDAVAGQYILNSTTGNLVTFNLTNSEMANIYRYSVKTTGNNAKINIDTKKHNHIKLNNKNNQQGFLKLNVNPVWTIDIDAGATDLDFNMKQFKVKKLNIDAGAADIDVTVGNKYPNVKIYIDAGAASITIRVPEEAGCKVDMDTFLANKTLTGFDKKDGKYITPDYDNTENKIYVEINSAISEINIIRY